MLLGEGGDVTGTISGGCLEAEMARKARWLTRNGAVVQRISTQMEDSADIPFGLGCGGTLDLLIEPAGTPEFAALMRAMEGSLNGRKRNVITRLPTSAAPLIRLVLDENGADVFRSLPLGSAERLQFLSREFPPNVFEEELSIPQRLLVVGAGDDARPLVGMAALLGWEVLVVDGRPQLARPERFPEASRVAVLPPRKLRELDLGRDDAVVVMTHSYDQDREAITEFLRVRPRYLGLLGARQRSALLLSEAAMAAGRPLASCCAEVHAPIGLDLGGDGPEAIALAIVAEVQACCMGKPSGSRRLSPENILRYLEQGRPEPVPTQCALDTA